MTQGKNGSPSQGLGADVVLVAAFATVLLACVGWSISGPFYEHAFVSCTALLVAGAGWWLALSRCAREPRRSPSVFWIVAGALVLRGVGLFAQPGLTDDLHRYVWEGELVRRGLSPYRFAPAAVELEPVREALPYTFAHLNNRDVSAAYPPLAQAVFVAVSFSLHPWLGRESVAGEPSDYEHGAGWVLRVVFTLADLALLVPLLRHARARGLGTGALVAWAWCPLVVVEYAGSGHFDSLALLLWWCALLGAAGGARPRARSALAWIGAVLVKYLPVASLPWIVRGPGLLGRATWLVLIGLGAFVPFVALGGWTLEGLGRGLGEYGLRWESQSLTYRYVESGWGVWFERDGTWLDVRRVGRATIALMWLGVLVWAVRRHRDDAAAAAGWVVGAFLILTPTLHPWYVTWIVPTLVLRATPAWCYLCVVSPLLYWPLQGWVARAEWVEPNWLWPVVALPFFTLLLAPAVRGWRSSP